MACFPTEHFSVVFLKVFSLMYVIRWHKLISHGFRGAIKTKHDRRAIIFIVYKAQDLNLGKFCARTKYSLLFKRTLFCSIFYALFTDVCHKVAQAH